MSTTALDAWIYYILIPITAIFFITVMADIVWDVYKNFFDNHGD